MSNLPIQRLRRSILREAEHVPTSEPGQASRSDNEEEATAGTCAARWSAARTRRCRPAARARTSPPGCRFSTTPSC